MAGVKAGNRAEVHIDALGRAVGGRVLWMNRSTGAEFSLLPRNVVSGEFTKVVQRIPVRIVLDQDQDLTDLRAGYSTRVTALGLKPRSAALPLRPRAARALFRLRISSVSSRTLPPRPMPSRRMLRV